MEHGSEGVEHLRTAIDSLKQPHRDVLTIMFGFKYQGLGLIARRTKHTRDENPWATSVSSLERLEDIALDILMEQLAVPHVEETPPVQEPSDLGKDGRIMTARLTNLKMLRESLSGNSEHASLYISRVKGRTVLTLSTHLNEAELSVGRLDDDTVRIVAEFGYLGGLSLNISREIVGSIDSMVLDGGNNWRIFSTSGPGMYEGKTRVPLPYAKSSRWRWLKRST